MNFLELRGPHYLEEGNVTRKCFQPFPNHIVTCPDVHVVQVVRCSSYWTRHQVVIGTATLP